MTQPGVVVRQVLALESIAASLRVIALGLIEEEQGPDPAADPNATMEGKPSDALAQQYDLARPD